MLENGKRFHGNACARQRDLVSPLLFDSIRWSVQAGFSRERATAFSGLLFAGEASLVEAQRGQVLRSVRRVPFNCSCPILGIAAFSTRAQW